MRKKIILFIILLVPIFYIININNSVKSNEVDFFKICQNVRCLVCQGQSIAESNSDFAQNLKLVIQNKIKNGSSEEEIYDFLKNKYGEWILFKPVFNYKSLLLWLLPYLIFIIGGICLFLIIKKRKSY